MAPDGADVRVASEDATDEGAASRAPSSGATSEAPHGDALETAIGSDDDPAAPDEQTESDLQPEAHQPAAVAVDLDELTARAGKADEYLDLAQRTKADFENYRKRAAREAALAQERGIAKLAKELLPAVDNLERALAHTPQSAEAEVLAFVSGVEHLRNDLIGALARVGIEQFSPDGEPFDPTRHEAVAQQPVEGAESGTVVEVYQRGYRIGETILRPARVLVAA